MTNQYSDRFRVWSLRLSVAITLIVILLSLINQVEILQLIIRAGVAFGVMYLLLFGTLNLFNKTAPQLPQTPSSDPKAGHGGMIDFSVGDDGPQPRLAPESRLPGQVDQDLSSGLPDSERQADIVRRMGWD